MTAEAQQTKNYYQLNGGLNTELNELGFPEGNTTDEANYEILPDGSRRRRKGLAAESGAGSAKTVDTFGSGYINQSYLWTNVGGNPDKKLMVFRTGDFIYFADADSTISDGWYSGAGSFVDTTVYRTDDATDALAQKEHLSFATGRGHLFVTGPYIKPFYIEYDSAADDFNSFLIDVRIRDYSTIDDGLPVDYEPTDATIPADHKYNLRNRGWNQARIDEYKTDQSKWPARNAIWWKGYERIADQSVASALVQDGVKTWNSVKMDAEAFGQTTAPTGSIFLNVFDTTEGYGNASSSGVVEITDISYSGGKFTITADNTMSGGETVVISGNYFTYLALEGVDLVQYNGSLNGTHTVLSGGDAPTATTFKIGYTPEQYNSGYSTTTLGSVDLGGTLARSTGTDHGDSFKAIEFHAGRVFYGGMKNTEFNDYIFFSQIGDVPNKYHQCFQEADPTDENFNSLVASDGGYIVIPGMGGVLNLVSVRNSLIILTTNGVWEITGGRAGVFTPNGYLVRQITVSGASGPDAFELIEDSLVYSGPGGIYIIAPNQYTGILEARNISENTIQTLWNQIADAEQKRVQMQYDNATKRLFLMYGPDGTGIGIDTMLILDSRQGAWFKYTFDTPTDNVLLTGFALENADDTSNSKKMKFVYQAGTTTVQIADFDQTSFDDWDGTNGPLPYMYTGWDQSAPYQHRRQAPIITVHSKRTETGYTASGNGWAATNPSSTTMTALWDWTDDAISNKIGDGQEVYRFRRDFVPESETDVTGYPVVTTRNKVRGRGQALQLKFEGAEDKDSHLLGYTVNFKVSRRK